MGITVQRHVLIDSSLQRIQDYLTLLAAELAETAPATNGQESTHQMALTVASLVAHLRQDLQTEQQANKASL